VRHFKGMFLILMVLLIGATEGVGVAQGPPRDFGGGPLNMGRLRTIGFEVGVGSTTLEGAKLAAEIGVISKQSTTVRSGTSACKCTAGSSGSSASNVTCNIAFAADPQTDIYIRAYVQLTTLPSATIPILRTETTAGTANSASVRLTSGGLLQLFNDQAGTQIGSSSLTALTTGVWYRVELHVRVDSVTAGNRQAALQLDGVSVASGLHTGTPANLQNVRIGWCSHPGITSAGFFIDDVAINNSSGASQNTWPGSGKVVLLIPTADSQVGSWTGGVGGLTNLFEAVNNTPPIGTATETDLTQIESADTTPDNATDEYRATMTTYSAAGLVASDTLTLVQAVVDHGEDVAAGTKTGSFLILSNPAQVTADTFTFGNDAGLLGTWPSGWVSKWGTAEVLPSVILGTAPVLRLRKTDLGSAVGSCDFMGICAEYVPAAVATTAQATASVGSRRLNEKNPATWRGQLR
jgi:hypothetical protein